MATEVFISYAREDRETAHALAEALAADGHGVWWDRELGGGADFSLEIERQLSAARVVIVLWSQASVQSGFVRDESSRARDKGKLLPLRIDDVPLPLGFGNLHTLDLIDWDGDADDESCVGLRDEVRRHLQRAAQGAAGSGSGGARTAVSRTPLAWRRWRLPLAAALTVALLGGGGWWWMEQQRQREALAQAQRAEQLQREQQVQSLFSRGLTAQFAPEPNLEIARYAYLEALRLRPDMGVAHYYLGHVYALLELPGDASKQFESALAHADELDEPMRRDADRQRAALLALLTAPEPAPMERAASAVAEAEPEPAPAAAVAAAPAVIAAAPPPPPPPAAVVMPPAAPAAMTPSPVSATALSTKPTLMRKDPGEATARAAQAQADALLGGDRMSQAAASTTLAIDAPLAADTLPLVMKRTLDTLAGSTGSANDDQARQAVSSALRLLRSASPALLRAHARDAQRIANAGLEFGGLSAIAAAEVLQRVTKAAGQKAFVYVQIADERQRALATKVAARMTAMGYSTPGIENVGAARAPAATQVRTQGASDPGLARWMASHLGKVVGAEVPVQPLLKAKPETDTYEIWFSRDLCVAPERRVPDCKVS